MPEVHYLDSSAIVKLVIRESESAALRRFLRGGPVRATSSMARTEVVRAVRRHDPKDVSRADQVLHDMYVIALDDELLRMAGLVDPPALRTLGAIHLASASSLAPDPVTLITYDSAMARAATTAGLPVRSPR